MPTADELQADIACLRCSVQSGDVPLLILGAVAGITSGGSGGGITSGSGAPVAAPSSSPALYIDTDTGTIYSFFNGSWH